MEAGFAGYMGSSFIEFLQCIKRVIRFSGVQCRSVYSGDFPQLSPVKLAAFRHLLTGFPVKGGVPALQCLVRWGCNLHDHSNWTEKKNGRGGWMNHFRSQRKRCRLFGRKHAVPLWKWRKPPPIRPTSRSKRVDGLRKRANLQKRYGRPVPLSTKWSPPSHETGDG